MKRTDFDPELLALVILTLGLAHVGYTYGTTGCHPISDFKSWMFWHEDAKLAGLGVSLVLAGFWISFVFRAAQTSKLRSKEEEEDPEVSSSILR